jgi:nitroimidazol reductase NimA-like FMN-containing flavoprotein (pyridoxamine 5'-phosphate oxidase superfamily)
MQIDLTPAQCEELLKKNYYAHLGCIDNDQPYVVPITYVYQDGFIYGLSMEGHKIDSMRKNPNICIQVEHIGGEHAWRSVLCWGSFEEITDPAQAQETKLLIADLHGQAILNDQEPPISQVVKSAQSSADESVVYRMKPTRITGKAEKGE